jgi:hypothetical protein
VLATLDPGTTFLPVPALPAYARQSGFPKNAGTHAGKVFTVGFIEIVRAAHGVQPQFLLHEANGLSCEKPRPQPRIHRNRGSSREGKEAYKNRLPRWAMWEFSCDQSLKKSFKNNNII